MSRPRRLRQVRRSNTSRGFHGGDKQQHNDESPGSLNLKTFRSLSRDVKGAKAKVQLVRRNLYALEMFFKILWLYICVIDGLWHWEWKLGRQAIWKRTNQISLERFPSMAVKLATDGLFILHSSVDAAVFNPKIESHFPLIWKYHMVLLKKTKNKKTLTLGVEANYLCLSMFFQRSYRSSH